MSQKEVKIFGKRVTLALRNEGDYAIAHELFLDHQYRFCDEVIRRAMNPIIDIGGHLGFFSLYASLLNPTVPIYSFEPHDGNFALLKENLKNNHIKNVLPRCLAVTSQVGQTNLHLSKEDLNHSTTHAIEPTGMTQTVQTTTLERIFEKNRIGRCDLVKMDCEGAEFEILYSTPKIIFDKISNIFLEYHEWTTPLSFGAPLLSSRASPSSFPRSPLSFPRSPLSFPRSPLSFPRSPLSFPRRRESSLSGTDSPPSQGMTEKKLGTTPQSQELKHFLEKKGFKVQKYPNHKIKELGFLWCQKLI